MVVTDGDPAGSSALSASSASSTRPANGPATAPATTAGPAPATAPATAPAGAGADVEPPQAGPVDAEPPLTTGQKGLGIALLLVLVFAFALAAPFLQGAQNIIGLLIIGFALWEAWKINTKQVPALTGPFPLSQAPPAAATPPAMGS